MVQILFAPQEEQSILIGEAGVGRAPSRRGVGAAHRAQRFPGTIADKTFSRRSLVTAKLVAAMVPAASSEERMQQPSGRTAQGQGYDHYRRSHTIVGRSSVKQPGHGQYLKCPASPYAASCRPSVDARRIPREHRDRFGLERCFQKVLIEPMTIEQQQSDGREEQAYAYSRRLIPKCSLRAPPSVRHRGGVAGRNASPDATHHRPPFRQGHRIALTRHGSRAHLQSAREPEELAP